MSDAIAGAMQPTCGESPTTEVHLLTGRQLGGYGCRWITGREDLNPRAMEVREE